MAGLACLRQQYLASTVSFLAGGKLYSYAAGTTTPLATYTDSTGVTPNANPQILDAYGAANTWLTPGVGYKFVMKDATDQTLWTIDNIKIVDPDLDGTDGAGNVGYDASLTYPADSVGEALQNASRYEFRDIGAGATGTLTVPAWAKLMIMYMTGAGGGGGGGNDHYAGGGGGSGNHAMWAFTGDTLAGKVLTYSCGTAGAPGAYNATTGTNGGQGTQTSMVWPNAWTQIAGGGEGGIGGTGTPTSGYISGQGGRGGNTAETGSVPAGISYGQFNLSSAIGQSAQIRKFSGTWTPVLTFTTPGDVAVTYATQLGTYEIDGDILTAWFQVQTSSFTFTTASGNMILSGLPIAPTGSNRNQGPLVFSGINKASYTQVQTDINATSTDIGFFASGMGQVISSITPGGGVTSATNVSLRGSVSYQVAGGSGSVGGWGAKQGDIGGGGKGGNPGAGGGTGTDEAQGGYIHIEFYG